ncbi:hypothetical protein NJB14197_19490 [Mycobacterium montefiorense]|uniref:Uncharacterized protein n=1 Tax=Mycobacterium montefiorense TaxID=154654 RepID=A0AA37PM27_9MYCO|nr:hypothetical protein MmonteBS_13660 [Mycobacterium montefiorense]GKU32869.1 hypothetical protein NJB14191_02160 [Mycobacterium montefiorense]GKU42546.1 hypothetical protein NJB14192_45290 [Mycobacterium montefiorense]GKU48297.1 hypothetical protein NJB14194_49120 [Mycobacterium montefiorense]GKU50799.1 hypothetical protein NJB14195_20450 [Mycobacterium montefiorense]
MIVGDVDHHLTVAHHYRVGSERGEGGKAQRTAVANIEARLVKWADYLVALEFAILAQRPLFVTAGVLSGVELTCNAKDRDIPRTKRRSAVTISEFICAAG